MSLSIVMHRHTHTYYIELSGPYNSPEFIRHLFWRHYTFLLFIQSLFIAFSAFSSHSFTYCSSFMLFSLRISHFRSPNLCSTSIHSLFLFRSLASFLSLFLHFFHSWTSALSFYATQEIWTICIYKLLFSLFLLISHFYVGAQKTIRKSWKLQQPQYLELWN